MSIFNVLGIYTRQELVENTRYLLLGNDQDLDVFVANARSAGQAKYEESAILRVQYQNLMTKAEAHRNRAIAEADLAIVMAQARADLNINEAKDRRSIAHGLSGAASRFARRHWFSHLDRDLDILLSHLGQDRSVLDDMADAARAEIALAEELEAQAAQTLDLAEKAEAEAISIAETIFSAAVEDAAPGLVKAKQLEKVAKSLIQSADFFTA